MAEVLVRDVRKVTAVVIGCGYLGGVGVGRKNALGRVVRYHHRGWLKHPALGSFSLRRRDSFRAGNAEPSTQGKRYMMDAASP